MKAVRLNIFYCKKTKGLDTSYKQHYIVLSLNVTSNLQMVQQVVPFVVLNHESCYLARSWHNRDGPMEAKQSPNPCASLSFPIRITSMRHQCSLFWTCCCCIVV